MIDMANITDDLKANAFNTAGVDYVILKNEYIALVFDMTNQRLLKRSEWKEKLSDYVAEIQAEVSP